MHHRPDEQGRVRDATADDDVRTLRQTARDVVATHVRVRRDDVLADAVDVFFARVQVRKLDPERTHLVEVGKYVVAGHDRDLQLAEAKALGDFDHLPRRGGRIGAAGVGNDLESLLARLWQGGFEPRLDVSDVSLIRVFCLLPLQHGKCQLGEVIEAQIVELPLVRQLDRRLEQVTPVRAAGAEPDLLHTGMTPLRRLGGGTSLRQ